MKRAIVLFALLASVALATSADSNSQVQTISISLRGADITVVAASFAHMTASELEIDPAVGGTIDLEVHDVTWMTALDAACEGVGCRWQLSGGHPRVLRLSPHEEVEEAHALDKRISLDLEDAALADVLTSFGQVASHEVEIESGLDGKVTLGIRNVSVRTALRAVCESVGCVWEEEDGILRFRASPAALAPSSKPD